MKGSPVNPDEQLHIGLCVTTWQRALRPHVLGHGSKHFLFIQALSWGHSELTIHSGRQDGGVPMYPTSHVHTLWPFTVRQRLLGPQGDGRHGSDWGSASFRITVEYNKKKHIDYTRKLNVCK